MEQITALLAALSQELYSNYLSTEDSVPIKQTKTSEQKSFAESSPLKFASSPEASGKDRAFGGVYTLALQGASPARQRSTEH